MAICDTNNMLTKRQRVGTAPLSRSHSGSDSNDSDGTCQDLDHAAPEHASEYAVASQAKASQPFATQLARALNGSVARSACQMTPSSALPLCPLPCFARSGYMPLGAAASMMYVSALPMPQRQLGDTSTKRKVGKPHSTQVSMSEPNAVDLLAVAAAAAATTTRHDAGVRTVLSKQLTKMDVACAHDSVGVVLPIEDVIKSQMLDPTMPSLSFTITDNTHKLYHCQLSRSSNGKFAYLTGLGDFLATQQAEPGHSLCIVLAKSGGLLAQVQPLSVVCRSGP